MPKLTPMSEELKGVSLSHATLRPADLIPCFVSALREIESDNPLIQVSLNNIETECQNPGYFESDGCQFDLDYLTDLLNAAAPDDYYFGAHMGDGSDFGFWECFD